MIEGLKLRVNIFIRDTHMKQKSFLRILINFPLVSIFYFAIHKLIIKQILQIIYILFVKSKDNLKKNTSFI